MGLGPHCPWLTPGLPGSGLPLVSANSCLIGALRSPDTDEWAGKINAGILCIQSVLSPKCQSYFLSDELAPLFSSTKERRGTGSLTFLFRHSEKVGIYLLQAVQGF